MHESIQKHPRILIIDNNPESIRALAAALPDHSIKLVATSGAKAFDLLDSILERPSLILLAMNLPQLSGYEVCSQLKADPRFQDIPVIFLSETNDFRNLAEGINRGAVDRIVKPIDPGEVLLRVQTHLKIFAMQKELEQRRQDLSNLTGAKARKITAMQLATVFALARLADRCDDETGNHLDRIRRLCASLARNLANSPKYTATIDETWVNNLFHASPLHDIGKIGIPDHICLKQDTLDAREYATMAQHTLFGAQLLEQVHIKHPDNQTIQTALEIARHHHERWDGQGYPDGLSGDRIPLSARIMAVADMYDALRMQRPYKKPQPHKDSVATILEKRGSYFDPDVVDAFFQIEAEIEKFYPAAGWTYPAKE